MNIFTLLLIALGLSMDALAVSITSGIIIKSLHLKHVLRIAFSFGLFQALMPVIGWFLGITFRTYIESFSHIVAFLLLSAVGIKMIYESRKLDCDTKDCTHLPTLLFLSLATSIDALAVGISFSMINDKIFAPALIIGLVTFVVCLVGIYVGEKIGHFFEAKLEIAGGIVLILIGLQILLSNIL